MDLQQQFLDNETCAAVFCRAARDLCHQRVFAQRVNVDVQVGRHIEVACIKSAALGFANILSGLMIVSLVAE